MPTAQSLQWKNMLRSQISALKEHSRQYTSYNRLIALFVKRKKQNAPYFPCLFYISCLYKLIKKGKGPKF